MPLLSRLMVAVLLSLAATSGPVLAQPAPPKPPPPKAADAEGDDAPDFSVYTPRAAESFSYMRLVDTPGLMVNNAEANLWQMGHLHAYFLTLAQLKEPGAPGRPQKPRLIGVDLGLARTIFQNYPILPQPPIGDDILPGDNYEPRWYAQDIYGGLDAVRASFTLSPYARDARFRPTLAIDTRVPLQENQGSTEILLRLMGDMDVSFGALPGRFSVFGAFQNKLVGLLEPVPGAKVGGSLSLVPGRRTFTLIKGEGALWGNGEFFDRTATFSVSQAGALFKGALVATAGLEVFMGAVDDAQYLEWSGGEEIPFSHALDLVGSARMTGFPFKWMQLYLGWEQVLSHRDSAFLDGFYRPTGPGFEGGMAFTVMSLVELGASISVNNWDGAYPPPYGWTDPEPPTGQWTQTAVTVELTGRF